MNGPLLVPQIELFDHDHDVISTFAATEANHRHLRLLHRGAKAPEGRRGEMH